MDERVDGWSHWGGMKWRNGDRKGKEGRRKEVGGGAGAGAGWEADETEENDGGVKGKMKEKKQSEGD